MTSDHQNSPAARPELRLGVTGHRLPPKLPDESIPTIRVTVRRLLERIGTAATPGPALTIVSSLAEGADQIVAEEGRAQGAFVEAVLPFPPDDYARDFARAETGRRFRQLLDGVSHCRILDVQRRDDARAYEAAGFAMLERSDILLAIWDESGADGRGGTAHVVERALEIGMPVLLLNPAAPRELTCIGDQGVWHTPVAPWLASFLAGFPPRGPSAV